MKRFGIGVVVVFAFLAILGAIFSVGADYGRMTAPVRTILETYPVIQEVQVPVEVVREVVVEKERIVRIYEPPRQFNTGDEFGAKMREYTRSITFLGGDCRQVALAFVEASRMQGYLVSTEMWYGDSHMVVSTILNNGDIWLFDPNTKRCWEAYSDTSYNW